MGLFPVDYCLLLCVLFGCVICEQKSEYHDFKYDLGIDLIV